MDTDGTEAQTDIKLEAENTETPAEEQKYTQAQVDEAKRQGQSNALADVGRFQREAENAVKASIAAQERTKKLLRDFETMELEDAKGNSESRSENEVKERQRRRLAEAELDETTLKLTQKDEELSQIKETSAEATKAQTARDVATRLNVDADRLVRLAKLTDGTVESIEELAKELTKKEVRLQVKTDSGVNTGSGDDATFLKDYGEGNLPYTKENRERAERLIK